MDYVLKHLSNNDNEIEDVYKDGAEYIIKIRLEWNCMLFKNYSM